MMARRSSSAELGAYLALAAGVGLGIAFLFLRSFGMALVVGPLLMGMVAMPLMAALVDEEKRPPRRTAAPERSLWGLRALVMVLSLGSMFLARVAGWPVGVAGVGILTATTVGLIGILHLGRKYPL